MVERLLEKGYAVVVFDKDTDAVTNICKRGAQAAASIQSLAAELSFPVLYGSWSLIKRLNRCCKNSSLFTGR